MRYKSYAVDVISAHSYSTHLTVSNCYLLFFYRHTDNHYLLLRWTDWSKAGRDLVARGRREVLGSHNNMEENYITELDLELFLDTGFCCCC